MASSTAAPCMGEATFHPAPDLQGMGPAEIAVLAGLVADYIWRRAIVPRATAEGLTITDEDRQVWSEHVEEAIIHMAEAGASLTWKGLMGELAALVPKAEGDA